MDIIARPLNLWDRNSIRPGPVGSVGDVNTSVRLKHSSPDMPLRFSQTFSGKNGEIGGSNVSDGMWHGFVSGGRVARTIREPLGNRSGFKTAQGWKFQNLQTLDRAREPIMGALGNYGYETVVSGIKTAKVTGDMFLPSPGGYVSTQLPRGSQNPRVTAESEGSGVPLPAADVKVTDPLFGENGSIEGNQKIMEPEYAVNYDITWTLPAGDPRREIDPGPLQDIEFVKLLHRGKIYNTYGWLDDSETPQRIFDKSNMTQHMGIANHTGGFQRPAGEPIPFVEHNIPTRGPKPNPYEYGKPGDKAPVPGQPAGGPIGGVPSGGGETQGGVGSGLQCRGGNYKGLFR